MMLAKNRAFWRALHGLSHPVSIAAILLLLFNDHYLRIHHASWLTGKLGDFTWLVFAPLIAALFFALVLPRRVKHHTGTIAFVTIAMWFALAKTVPLAHFLTTTLLDAIVGWRGSLRMDATDLLTLPALLIGWHIWRNASDAAINLRPVSYVAFGLGLLGTMATSQVPQPPQDNGVTCLAIQDESLIVANDLNTYSSNDGGLSWEAVELPGDIILDCHYLNWKFNAAYLQDSARTNVSYQFVTGKRIERSSDGGQTWVQEVDLTFIQQDAWKIYHHQNPNNLTVRIDLAPGPFSAVFDEKTGNLVVAMGHDGILVRPPYGEWQWVTVAHYHKARLEVANLSITMNREFVLALWLVILVFGSSLKSNQHCLSGAILLMAWGCWFLAGVLQPAKIRPSNMGFLLDLTALSPILDTFILLAGILACLIAVLNFTGTWKHLMQTFLLMLTSVALFFLPYVLWVNRTIPSHTTASLFSMLLGGVTGVVGSLFLQQDLPEPDYEKRKNEEKAKSGEQDNNNAIG